MFDDVFKNYPDMDCDGDHDIFDFIIYNDLTDKQNADKPQYSYDDEDEEDEFGDEDDNEYANDEESNECDDDMDWGDSDQDDCW